MIVEYIAGLIINMISFFGYFGVFLLMILESMIFPVPSEVVMPFAGFLITEQRFTFLGIFIASSLGSVAGSLISYYIGKYGGRPFIVKYGRYFLLSQHHLYLTEKFFKKRGEKTIFISRFIPVVRHLISIPAGIAEMNLKKFIFYTFAGAAIWNMFLTFVGFKLKENWDLIHTFSTELDFLVILILLILVVFFIIKRLRNKK